VAPCVYCGGSFGGLQRGEKKEEEEGGGARTGGGLGFGGAEEGLRGEGEGAGELGVVRWR
jgi:hypothetical protein